ncbi:DUF2802 domain-containing protein [Aliidiomarina soli]|nr:DUF2802 domain-containing protein [Aliidiomarina soli]
MHLLFANWLSMSIALAALAGVIVVVIALVRQRHDMVRTAQAITDAAQVSAKAVAETAAEKAAKAAARKETQTATEPVIATQQKLDEQFSALEKTQQALEQSFAELRQQQEALQAQQKSLQDMQNSLEERQADVEEQTPESRFYQRAAKLVEKGASVEDLMKDCEIPRNEAELLISLHRRD